ncbi:Protein piccolo [Labeo rohita]|uniref:Protein piccolo n=1 Tax=Labeo rohita TaxID=84645 RepID=A0ABQ8LYB1_LABRO|nr:Protein piccolo [Labeo rohita]
MPRNTPQWTLENYIDLALRLSGSPFTVGIADEGPHIATVTTTPKAAQVMSGIVQVVSEPPQTKPAKSKPVQATSTKPRSANVTSAKLQPVHSTSARPQPVHVTSTKPKPAHAMPAAPGPPLKSGHGRPP